MAPSILGIGVSASSPTVPAERREALGKVLEDMDADMRAFSSGWEIFYVEPDMDFGLITRKLKEKKWDVVLVGTGLRTMSSVTPFFEKIVNAAHEELPTTKFAFNTQPDKTREACERVLGA